MTQYLSSPFATALALTIAFLPIDINAYWKFLSDIIDIETRLGGTGVKFRFENGYGASLINHSGSYGNELAVLHYYNEQECEIDYDTPITGETIGYIETLDELTGYLEQIQSLPRKEV